MKRITSSLAYVLLVTSMLTFLVITALGHGGPDGGQVPGHYGAGVHATRG